MERTLEAKLNTKLTLNTKLNTKLGSYQRCSTWSEHWRLN